MNALYFLTPYLRRYFLPVLAGTFWLAATNILGAVLPWLLKEGIDAISRHDSHRLTEAALLLGGVAIVRGGARLISRFRFLHSARAVELDLRADLMRGLLAKPFDFFDRHRTGDLLSRFTNDLSNVRMLAGFGVLTMVNSLLVYIVTLVMLLRLSPTLTAIALIPYPLMFLFVKRMSKRMMALSTAAQESLGRVSQAVEETVSGETVVRAFALGPVRIRHFADCNADYLQRNLDLTRLRAFIMPVMTVVGPIGALLTLYFGGKMVSSGEFTLGELVAFTAYLAQLVMPTLTLGWVMTLVQRCAASMERLSTVLGGDPPADPLPPLLAPPMLQVRNLNFGYDSGPLVLKAIDLDIPAGSVVGIVGPTGAGKSTLLRLLTGLYPPPAGTVRIDGEDLATLNGGDYRRRLAVVPQEGRLFSGSMEENLLYGVPAGDAALLQRVSDEVALSAEIARFPQGYQTRVGEGGVAISGGQRQRVCLGRALARDGGLWLLDDPLSHLDAATARTVWSSLRRRLAGRTVLVTSSRVSFLVDADIILLFENGSIVACGRHAELLATSPLYARLAEQEKLRDEVEEIA
jgi:ATP-binding cassette, subfamily B, multidrug efflux pump